MLKRLLFTCLLMYSATMGLNTANVMAAEPTVTTGPIEASIPVSDSQPEVDNSTKSISNIDQSSEQSKQPQPAIDANQAPGAENEVAEATSGKTVNQDQSVDKKVIQNQDVSGGSNVDQHQTATIDSSQQQTNPGSSQDNGTGSTDGSGGQNQTANIEAAQMQNVTSSADVNAEETQAIGLAAEQKLEITDPTGVTELHNQNTTIAANQAQNILANLNADLFQGQIMSVNHSEDLQLGADQTKVEVDKQLTNLEGFQYQFLHTPGSAKMEQTQSAEVKSGIANPSIETAASVSSKNSIEIIKDSAATAVKFFQEVFVNNELVDRITNDYTIDQSSPYLSLQQFQKQYNWGSLTIENSATVLYSEQLQNLQATLSSYLKLVFSVVGTKPEPPANSTEDTPTATPQQDTTEPAASPGDAAKPQENPNTNQALTSGSTVITAAAPVSNNEVTVTASEENPLPNTATNDYNLLMFGAVFMAAGLLLPILRRKIIN